MLYDKTPTELVFTIGNGESKFTELKTESGSAFSQIKLDGLVSRAKTT